MELKEFLKPFIKNWIWIVGSVVVMAIAGYLMSTKLPIKYRASATVYVQRLPEEQQGEYYSYEGFYTQKAAQEYTDTVLGFLKSPDIIQRAGKIVWDEIEEAGYGRIERSVYVKKTAPQLVYVSVTWPDAKESSKLVSALAQAASERAQLLNKSGNQAMSIDLLAVDPLVKTVKPLKVLNAIVCSGVGFIIASIVIWFKEYFQEG